MVIEKPNCSANMAWESPRCRPDGLDVHGFDVDYMHAIRGRIGLTLSNFHSGLHAFDEFLAKFAHDCTLDSTGAERKLSTETGFELILLFLINQNTNRTQNSSLYQTPFG